MSWEKILENIFQLRFRSELLNRALEPMTNVMILRYFVSIILYVIIIICSSANYYYLLLHTTSFLPHNKKP